MRMLRCLLTLTLLVTGLPGIAAAATASRAAVMATAGAAKAAAPFPTVRVLIWEEFFSPKVLKFLKNRDGINVELLTFSTSEQRDALLAKNKGRIDLMVADSPWISQYRRRGLLQPIDASRVPSLKHVLTRWQSDSNYAVPYLWGQTGIAWRTDLVKTPPRTYAELLALAKQNPGKVSLIDDTQEAMRGVLYATGAPPYAMKTPAQVAVVAKQLDAVRRNVRFVGSELEEDSPWVTGEIIAGQAYNGDVAFLRDNFHVPIAFVMPSPGCMIWQEHFLLLANAPHKDAAYRFLDSINDPEIAARNATDVRYATSNVLAVDHLPAEFRADPVIRPTFEGLDDCYFYESVDEATQAAINAIKIGTK